MNLLEKMNTVIEYIEENITDELDLNKISCLACCSVYNFQRMFTFIADISVVEYIRNRRLSLAALELHQTNKKVIDVALKYGYDSPISFGRAFKALHGINPSDAKKTNISLKMFPKLTFQIIIKGVNEMNYRIVKTESFKVFGIEGIISTAGDKKYFLSAGAIWQENFNNGKYDKLLIDSGTAKHKLNDKMFTNEMCKVHGLMNYKKTVDTTYVYLECSFVNEDSNLKGYEVVEIPQTTWAVFPSELFNWDEIGNVIDNIHKRFYNEWLPNSEYEKADSPEFEMYGGTNEKGYIEIWMPIIKK